MADRQQGWGWWGAESDNIATSVHLSCADVCILKAELCPCLVMKKAQLEECVSSRWNKSPGRKIISLRASNNPPQPCLLTTPDLLLLLPPVWAVRRVGGWWGETTARMGPSLFAHKHTVQQVRAPLMNYSSASISSVEVPDKSQALKCISRLTCLHKAGLLPLLPSSILLLAPPPRLAISAWQKPDRSYQRGLRPDRHVAVRHTAQTLMDHPTTSMLSLTEWGSRRGRDGPNALKAACGGI